MAFSRRNLDMKSIGFFAIFVISLSINGEVESQNLGNILVSTPMYTASQTDERIRELAGSSDKITDGTNTIDAARNVVKRVMSPWMLKSFGETNYNPIIIMTYGQYHVDGGLGYYWISEYPYNEYGDYLGLEGSLSNVLILGKDDEVYFSYNGYEVGNHSETNITSIGFEECYIYRDSIYYNKTVGKLAMTSDIPHAVSVVAPSTNAVSGTAADAKATGTALYTGFTEWEFSGTGYNPSSQYAIQFFKSGPSYNATLYVVYSDFDREAVDSVLNVEEDIDRLIFPNYGITATRHLITPTKTSQLTNDGTNGVPFAVLSDSQVNAIDSVVDDRQTVVVYSNGTTNRLDLVGVLSYSDIPDIGDATSVRIGTAVTSIGDYVFSGCSGLKSVTIPDGVTSIGGFAFFWCSGLTSVTFPNSVTNIWSSAFSNCTNLTSVTIPDSITRIGSTAFEGCSGLTSVMIGKGVTSIGNYAFNGCSGLTSVIFKGKSLAEVSSMPNYSSWGITDTSIIKTENEATKEWTGDNFLAKTGGVVRGSVTIYGGFAQGCADNTASGFCSHAEGTNTVASQRFAHSEGYMTVASGVSSKASGLYSKASGRASVAIGANSDASNSYTFVWSGFENGPTGEFYGSHGSSTFNINPSNGLAGVWIGETNLQSHIRAEMSSKADVSDLSYSIVTPGEWEFSDGEPHLIDIDNFSGDWKIYADDAWPLNESGTYATEVEAQAVLDSLTSCSFTVPYGQITASRASLPGHLLDRANNLVKSSDTLQMTLPPPIPNKSRDFRVRLVITAPITLPDKITFVGATTNGVQETISFETENGTFPTLNTISTNILHFTETAPSLFYISNKTAIPTPAP